jgi:general secretion pathway protein G
MKNSKSYKNLEIFVLAKELAVKVHLEILHETDRAPRPGPGSIQTLQYPTTTEGLNALVTNPGVPNLGQPDGPYLKKAVSNDPRGRPYVYQSPGSHGDYDLIFYGADGALGGEGENKDIVSWQ